MKTIKKLSSIVLGLFAVSACAVGFNMQTASADEDPMNLVDVTENVSISNWIDQAEWQVTYLSLGAGVMPDIGYGIIDNAYKYVQGYIAINGKTIQEINADDSLGAKDWTYTVYPSSSLDAYKLPVIVYENNDMLEIKIHDTYLETLGDKVEVTAKAGLYFEHNMTKYEVKADKTFTVWESSEADITANITAEGWDKTGDATELVYTRLSLGAGVLPAELGYGIIDKVAYQYMQEYIAINGKTIKEINETTDVTGYNFATFPFTIGAPFNVPVVVYMNNDKLEIKVHGNYAETLGDSVVLTVKAGFSIENAGRVYKVTADKDLTVLQNSEVDITENITAEGWDKTGNATELVYTRLFLGEGVLPAELDYGIMDKAAYQYMQEYIAINGKTIKEINETTDVTGYNFATFPSTIGAPYNVPVIIYMNNDKLEIKVHGNYVETLGDSVTLTVKAGLLIENAGKQYVVSADKALTVWEKVVMPETDIAENITAQGWDATGNANELVYTRLFLGEGVLPAELGYGIIDKVAYKYMQEYIAINGKTIKEINETTDVTGYNFATFPFTIGAPYNVPVIIYMNNDKLEIKVHGNYAETLGDSVTLTVKAGFAIENEGMLYKVTADKDILVWEKVILPETNIAGDISLNGWTTTGNASELTYVRIQFGEGVLPEELYYSIMDRAEWMYLQEYILFNGKTVKEINATTDVSEYVFSTFPSTVSEIYQLPIMIYANNNTLEVKFHNTYLETAGDTLEITLKAGVYTVNNGTQYVIDKDMNFLYISNIWADTNRTYTITYYVNGNVYGETEQFVFNTPFTVRDDVTAEKGYAFSGWEYTATATVVQDMEIHGYLRPVCYTITYQLNGGKNNASNPITYFVTDGEVILKDATKEGAVFKGWYTDEACMQKIDKLSADTLSNLQLYALFEEESSKKGCGSVTGMGSALIALAGVALLTKKRKNDE